MNSVSQAQLDVSSTFELEGTLLETRLVQGKPATAWLCSGRNGEAWDDFLRACPLGHFQQSSLWAQNKDFEGWKDLRVIIERQGRIVGGFQILWRRSRFGRIGYISKGPALSSEDSEGVAFALDVLQGLVRSHRLRAIVVQPPDEAHLLPQELVSRGFLPTPFMNVISATCLVDLSGPPGEWEKGLKRTRKQQIRQALHSELTVREGGDADIPKFFDLMAATCARQHVQPNPGSVDALRRLVRAFQASGEVRLSFVEYYGEAIAGVLALQFGDRVTLWKKGWSGAHSHLHANTLLYYESLGWAQRVGGKRLDFVAMGRSLAERLLAQGALTEEDMKHRDFFNISFGARPVLLPPALIYWRSAALRYLYSGVLKRPWLVAKLSRVAFSS